MKLFLKTVFRFLLIGIPALVCLLVGYLYFDPFKVVKPYKCYSNFHIITNREYISTEKFLYNRSRHPYNSFVFGSSRTIAFRANSWLRHLNAADVPFYFDASAENLYGIYTKLRFLDSLHQKIANALVLLDVDHSFSPSIDSLGHLYIRHPLLSGNPKFDYQYSFLKAYLQPKFLVSYYAYIHDNKYRPFMKNILAEKSIVYDSISNEIDLQESEHEIRTDSIKFYSKLKDVLYNRGGGPAETSAKIKGQYLFMLDSICHFFERNHTNFKVIISPAYDEGKFSKEDMNTLKVKFKSRLYDFSGRNYFTEDKGHYYETNHFRPLVGDSILNIVYNDR